MTDAGERDVERRLEAIRQRFDDDCMGRANQREARRKLARSDVPYLLDLVEEIGEALAAIPSPYIDNVLQSVEKHADYDAARTLAQVRDAALQQENDDD